MAKPNEGNQRGAQQHAEGQHGDRTYAANKARINGEQAAGDDADDSAAGRRAANDPNAHGKRSDRSPDGERELAMGVNTGKHKLFEDRQQHDEADKNSEKTRGDRVGSPLEDGRAGERNHQ